MTIDDPLAVLDQEAHTGEPDLTRISILGGNTQLDVALPSSVPVAALLPDLVALIESRNPRRHKDNPADDDKREHWTLSKVGRDPIESHRTLHEAQILDGDLLILKSVVSRETPALFDDVIDAVGRLNESRFTSWSARSARIMGYVVAMVASVAAALILLMSRGQADNVLPGAISVVLAIGFIVAATIVVRYYRDEGTATVLSFCAQPLVFAGAMLLTPHGFGAPHLTFACAASLVSAVIVYRVTTVGPMMHSAILFASIGGLIAAGEVTLFGSDVAKVGAAMAALSVLCVLLAPRFTIGLARLPLPPVPTSGGPIDPIDAEVRPTIEGVGAIGAMALPSAAALERRAYTANQYLTGIVLGIAVLAGVGALLAADPLNGFDWRTTALAIIVAVVLALRGRAHSDVAQTAILVATGAIVFALLMAGLAVGDLTWMYIAFGCVLALALLAILTGVVAPQQEFSPVMKRTGEILEYILVGIIAPLTFWVMDIYGTVRSL
ncbi:type VII secretion integral membrane protein EccD [Gordonia sp. SID5947]|uniref:type VII secretion integral membrane protein EccD n=1 Tax=Gordonia sp. SID5947 TaxID=2690315 RepID=UPI0013704EC5|nr:type VII secretion integral membrane protein EccD [Gordonia sp. SID5947]MYR07531.1 type VII secretion integral membrane protein EccD [Gordonia sp. SID5947]